MDSARIQSAGSTAPMLADGEPQLFSLFPSPIPHEVELTKYITGIDARGYLHVYEYLIPGFPSPMMIDVETRSTALHPPYRVRLLMLRHAGVHFTPILKSCGFKKADVVKLCEDSPEITDHVIKIRGGFLKIQGTWLPYEIGKVLSRRIAYHIRHHLVPIFGPDFPDSCLLPTDAGFGYLVMSSSTDSIPRPPPPATRVAPSCTPRAPVRLAPAPIKTNRPRRNSRSLAVETAPYPRERQALNRLSISSSYIPPIRGQTTYSPISPADSPVQISPPTAYQFPLSRTASPALYSHDWPNATDLISSVPYPSILASSNANFPLSFQNRQPQSPPTLYRQPLPFQRLRSESRSMGTRHVKRISCERSPEFDKIDLTSCPAEIAKETINRMFGHYSEDGEMSCEIEGGVVESTLDASGIGKDSEFMSELVQLNPIDPSAGIDTHIPPPLDRRTSLPPLSTLDPTTRRKSLSPPRLLFHPDMEFFKAALPDAHSHFNIQQGSRDEVENQLQERGMPANNLGFFPSDPIYFSGQLSPVGFNSFGAMQRGMMHETGY